jgi:hypothetical protein
MKIVANELVGQYFCSRHVTYHGPTLVAQLRIELRLYNEVVLMVRGQDTMWFNAAQCVFGDKGELEDWIEMRRREELVETRTFICGANR